MLGIFIALYALLGVANVVVYIKRKSVFEPVLAIHQNRSDKTSDFSAFGESTFITNTIRGLSEQILWADVSLRVPGARDIAFTFVPIVFGFIILLIVTSVVPNAGFFSIVFLITLIPPVIVLVTGYKQIFKGSHYTHVNALTPRGAHIIELGMCGNKSNFFPYDQMFNIHTEGGANGVGTVYFAERWELEKVKETHAHRGHLHTTEHKEWKKHGVGFVNVVQPMEVQGIIVANVPQYGVAPNPVYPPQPVLPGFPPVGIVSSIPGVQVSFNSNL